MTQHLPYPCISICYTVVTVQGYCQQWDGTSHYYTQDPPPTDTSYHAGSHINLCFPDHFWSSTYIYRCTIRHIIPQLTLATSTHIHICHMQRCVVNVSVPSSIKMLVFFIKIIIIITCWAEVSGRSFEMVTRVWNPVWPISPSVPMPACLWLPQVHVTP